MSDSDGVTTTDGVWLDDTTHRAVLEQSKRQHAMRTTARPRCMRERAAEVCCCPTLTTRHTERCWNSVVRGREEKRDMRVRKQREKRQDAMEGERNKRKEKGKERRERVNTIEGGVSIDR